MQAASSVTPLQLSSTRLLQTSRTAKEVFGHTAAVLPTLHTTVSVHGPVLHAVPTCLNVAPSKYVNSKSVVPSQLLSRPSHSVSVPAWKPGIAFYSQVHVPGAPSHA